MDDKGFEIQFLVGAKSFLFATIFRPVLGLAQIPTQWAPQAVHLEENSQFVNLTTHLVKAKYKYPFLY
jgi:hypothetical protein